MQSRYAKKKVLVFRAPSHGIRGLIESIVLIKMQSGLTSASESVVQLESDTGRMTLKVKLLRSRRLKRVLCLECDKEFADLLFSLLIMPVGKILKHIGEGGLSRTGDNGLFNLYASTKTMEESAFRVDRQTLIDPAVVAGGWSGNTFLCIADAKHGKCINNLCENVSCNNSQLCDGCEIVAWRRCSTFQQDTRCSGVYHGSSSSCSRFQQCVQHVNNQSYGDATCCPSCNQPLTDWAVVIRKRVQTSSDQKTKVPTDGVGNSVGFVEKNITFMVKEDLSIIKSSALSALELLQTAKSDLGDLDTKEVNVGKKEGLLLVKAAMMSKTPLTDVFDFFFR